MKILYYDCFSGISGDMNLGAMVDIGVPEEYLINELGKLNVEGYKVSITKDMKKGISGTKVKVILFDEENEHGHPHAHHDNHLHEHGLGNQHGDGHSHDHGFHEHEHGSVHEAEHHHHPERNLKDIEDIINKSSLGDNVKKISKNILFKVAEAEARVHGKEIYEVHFHEVGAVDSIVDIVGAAICLDYLKVDCVMSSSVELGGGFVRCAHGLIPVPAPATVEILKGIPVKQGIVPFETTTPTGAAILAATVKEFRDKTDFTILRTGYGIGQRDTDIPNVLRAYIGEICVKEGEQKDSRLVIECNIDDLNPEIYEYIMDRLFEAGADDVTLIPMIMKKSRPAVRLSALCSDEFEDAVTRVIFEETTSLGIRKYVVNRNKLQRSMEEVATRYGMIRIKNSYYRGKLLNSKPEYEDCKKAAQSNNIPLKKVYEEVNMLSKDLDGGRYGH